MPDDAYALRAEGIGKDFGANTVLKSAALWARRGEITTLLGRNGSGKTTLMRIAAGQLRPDQGTVRFPGGARGRLGIAAAARWGLMYLPQDQLVVPRCTVRDHFGALSAVFESSDVAGAVRTARLEGIMDQRIHSLSRGERIRVSIALALARRPVVLLADEPLVGLAPKDQKFFGGLLRRLAAEGAAVVTAGHDARILLSISDVILWSVAGTTHHLGSPSEALRHEQFRREYLGPGFELGPGPPAEA